MYNTPMSNVAGTRNGNILFYLTLLNIIIIGVFLAPYVFGEKSEPTHDEVIAENVDKVLDDMEFCKSSKIILEDGVTEDGLAVIWFNGKNLHLESTKGEVVRMNVNDITAVKCVSNSRSVREYIITTSNDKVHMKCYYPQFEVKVQ